MVLDSPGYDRATNHQNGSALQVLGNVPQNGDDKWSCSKYFCDTAHDAINN